MKTALIDIIAGARPNFMKIAPIIHAIQAMNGGLQFRLVHTGQHYDEKMSGEFFRQLEIPAPDINLEVGSGSAAEQTGEIMCRYEKLLQKSPSDLCLVVGDVTSTMACAIAAQKMGIKVAHVEAGIRSGDWTMPEEINRMVTDSISNWFFTTSETANANLRMSGVEDSRIYFVGNTMIDTLLANLPKLRQPECWHNLNLSHKKYVVLTLHRPANVDDSTNLQALLLSVSNACQGLPVVFPVHPRTRAVLSKLPALPSNLHLLEPQPYLEFIYLVRGAMAIITDSGGITEEATVLNVPCLTLRANTERPETIELGTNELLGTEPEAIAPAMARVIGGNWKDGQIPPLWDGLTARRIIKHLSDLLLS